MGTIIAVRKKPKWLHKGAHGGVAHARKRRWPVPDKGKKGKTPKEKQWSKGIRIPEEHKISGYSTGSGDSGRQSALIHEVIQRGGGRAGTRSTFRTLNYLRNLGADERADAVFKRDANWLGKKYGFKIRK